MFKIFILLLSIFSLFADDTNELLQQKLELLEPLAVDTNAKWMDRKYVSWEDLEHDCEVDEEFTENF